VIALNITLSLERQTSKLSTLGSNNEISTIQDLDQMWFSSSERNSFGSYFVIGLKPLNETQRPMWSIDFHSTSTYDENFDSFKSAESQDFLFGLCNDLRY
jgi:hypothetical protein